MDFQVKVIANADRNEIIELTDDFLKVKITASPAKGKANQALIKLLAKQFGTPTSNIEIIRGPKSSHKVIRIST